MQLISAARETLRDAGRDLVEAFVSTVAEEAAKDRVGTDLQVEQLQPA